MSAEDGRLILEKDEPPCRSTRTRRAAGTSAAAGGRTQRYYRERHPALRTLARCRADTLFNNDVPIPQAAGGYCFGRRPAPYEMFYIRSDTGVLTKRGARANLGLDIVPVMRRFHRGRTNPNTNSHRRIIDKRDAVRILPDDVFVEQVVWEYYNGTGWGGWRWAATRNPFSCKQEGRC